MILIGCLVGLAAKLDMLDENGKLPKAKQALFADAIRTTVGAVLGTSTVTTFVRVLQECLKAEEQDLLLLLLECFFLASLLFSPIFIAIPSQATAPVLILVGVMMASSM